MTTDAELKALLTDHSVYNYLTLSTIYACGEIRPDPDDVGDQDVTRLCYDAGFVKPQHDDIRWGLD